MFYYLVGCYLYLNCFVINLSFNRFITLGYKKPLEREDLSELIESVSSYIVCPEFEKHWRKEVFKKSKDIKVILMAIKKMSLNEAMGFQRQDL